MGLIVRITYPGAEPIVFYGPALAGKKVTYGAKEALGWVTAVDDGKGFKIEYSVGGTVA